MILRGGGLSWGGGGGRLAVVEPWGGARPLGGAVREAAGDCGAAAPISTTQFLPTLAISVESHPLRNQINRISLTPRAFTTKLSNQITINFRQKTQRLTKHSERFHCEKWNIKNYES